MNGQKDRQIDRDRLSEKSKKNTQAVNGMVPFKKVLINCVPLFVPFK